MKVVVCIDDHGGMLFHKRRQSRDKVLLADLMKDKRKVWIHSFSEKLFTDYVDKIIVNDKFLELAGKEEVCFVENQLLKPYEANIEQLIIYKWNRKYPSDFCLDLDLNQWELEEQTEFAGNSHEKITRELYSRRV